MNAAAFFAAVRVSLFDGRLSQSQVDGLTRLLDAFELIIPTADVRFPAYILATSYHETGRRMQPVREDFASTDAGARAAVAKLFKSGRISKNYALPNSKGRSFYGRGDVQLTFEENYRKMGDTLGIDLVGNPDLALDPSISAAILIEGMTDGKSNRGDFTGKALDDYFSATKNDPVGARRIVNGTDKAADIAKYYGHFLTALKAAGWGDSRPALVVGGPPALNYDVWKKGVVYPELRRLQETLKAIGYSAQVGNPDGKWGTFTRNAILAFKADNGLPATDDLDNATWAAVAKAQPKVFSEERSTATVTDLAPTSPTIQTAQKASWWARLMKWLAAGGTTVAALYEPVSATVPKVATFKTYLPDVPDGVWLAAAVAIGVGVWLAANKIQNASNEVADIRVAAHRVGGEA